jgi:outer membrane lipoprotein-sorting protein
MGALGAALASPSIARADSVSDALGEITKARAGIKTLVGEFTQERKISLLSSTVKSTGEMTLVRPDKLRWELKPPDAVTYWITPEGFAFAAPGSTANVGKSAAGRFGAVLGDLLVMLGGDLETLRSRYEFSVPSRENGIVLAAKPKAEEVSKHVKRLELTAGKELWTVTKIVIEEVKGDSSTITFTKLQRDLKVDDAKMKPPK